MIGGSLCKLPKNPAWSWRSAQIRLADAHPAVMPSMVDGRMHVLGGAFDLTKRQPIPPEDA